MLGMLIGLAGVVALVGIDLSGESGELLGAGQSAVMIAAVGHCAPLCLTIISNGISLDYDPGATMAASLPVAAVLPHAVAGLHDRSRGPVPAPRTPSAPDRARRALHGGSLVILMVLVSEVGAGRAAIITYINPVIAVALGVIVLGRSPAPGRSRDCCSSLLGRGSPPTIACRRTRPRS